MGTDRQFSLGFFAVISFSVVILVFGTTAVLEKTLFDTAAEQTIRYLHVARGLTASLLVAMAALVFFIADRRKIEFEHRKLLRAVEQSPVTILVTNRAGSIEYVNPRFSIMTGYTREEVLGKNPRILKSGQTPLEKYAQLWQTITSGREWRGEFMNRKKNGEFYWEECSISPLINSRGEVTHFMGVLEDITGRKKMDELKDSFLGVVSHELRTPLALINLSVSSLLDGLSGPLEGEQRETVRGIEQNCRRLSRIVEDLLDLSRLESGKAKIKLKQVDIIPLIRKTADFFRKGAASHSVVIEEELPSALPALYADEDHFVQLISNLLDNAVRFAISRVVVRVMIADQGPETRDQRLEAFGLGSHVSCLMSHVPCLLVSVMDDGPGISEGDQKRLFQKFERADSPSKKKGYKGTGLGLAICKQIVERHGGKIWVDSAPEKGAKFHVLLPFKAAERNGTMEEFNHGGRNHGTKKENGARC